MKCSTGELEKVLEGADRLVVIFLLIAALLEISMDRKVIGFIGFIIGILIGAGLIFLLCYMLRDIKMFLDVNSSI